ncbi:uncharacterized protein LTR77_001043 [Saxophila tyrrhenica]|uniref:Enoyl reductase (ER) domain-containing protein n=1 Tax=Saxophila tyrrhenica TaxID=1690608 RepID=A0AAV9PU86_9PEZI|nr:hypothetical protein LTR77_001043 [Saxophila tyrrhenica]
MATQRALLVEEICKPLVLVHDRSIPTPRSGQVQIKVTVAGLNPHDQRSRDTGLLIGDKLPAILSKDVVGTVSRIGEDVTGFRVGDRIMSLGSGAVMDSSQSGLQEYALADVVNCTKVPDNISDDEAATLPTNVSAAFVALFDVLQIPVPWEDSGTTPSAILIVGGGSNCGKLAVQLAKLRNIQQIVVVGGDEMRLKKLGATHVIDRHLGEGAVVKRIRDAAGDDLIYALDAVNMPQGLGVAFKALSTHKQGKVARLLPVGDVEDRRGHDLLDVLGLFLYHNPPCLGMWERLTGYVEDGAISPTSFSTRQGLEAGVVNAALDEYRNGKNKAKPQIRIG